MGPIVPGCFLTQPYNSIGKYSDTCNHLFDGFGIIWYDHQPPSFEKIKPHLLEDQQTQLTPLSKLYAGAMAGIISVCCTYPLDFIRTRLTVQDSVIQKQYNGIWDVFQRIVQQEGVRGLYRGISPTLLGVAPYVGLNFLVFESLREKAPLGMSRHLCSWFVSMLMTYSLS